MVRVGRGPFVWRCWRAPTTPSCNTNEQDQCHRGETPSCLGMHPGTNWIGGSILASTPGSILASVEGLVFGSISEGEASVLMVVALIARSGVRQVSEVLIGCLERTDVVSWRPQHSDRDSQARRPCDGICRSAKSTGRETSGFRALPRDASMCVEGGTGDPASATDVSCVSGHTLGRSRCSYLRVEAMGRGGSGRARESLANPDDDLSWESACAELHAASRVR